MKTSRKLLVLVLALVMVFACAVPAFAMGDTGTSYLEPSTHPVENNSFTVTLSIHSGKIGSGSSASNAINRYFYVVDMGTDGVPGSYTVADVLNAAAAKYSWLSFEHNGEEHHPGTYVSGVIDSTVLDSNNNPITFEPVSITDGTRTGYCGWMFMVNGKFPKIDATNGALIHQAYVKAGDHIDLYFANSLTSTNATRRVFLEPYSYSGTTLKLKGWSAYSYYNSNGTWIISSSYSPITSGYFSIKIDNTTYSRQFSENGLVTFNNISTGVHTITIMPKYNTFTSGIGNYQLPSYLGYTFMVNIQ